jgi:hypothetical protein
MLYQISTDGTNLNLEFGEFTLLLGELTLEFPESILELLMLPERLLQMT